ncbi:MAG: hypothetical protein K2H56_03230 [Malacoplasma sp.]|nr:hypothetical protein [Malacoplasma sp.]
MENSKKFDLLIDGCLDYLEIAIIKNNKIFDLSFEIQNKNLTKIFNPSVSHIIKKNNLKKEDIENIYIINGPGSFTSQKTVVIFANTFKKVFPKTNLFYLNSLQWCITKNDEISFIDAKTELFYVASNNFKKPFLIKKTEVEKLSNQYNKYFYNLESKKNIFEKWEFNSKRFIPSDFIKPLYIKKPVYDYHQK